MGQATATCSRAVMLAKLANAYGRAEGDDEKAARILGGEPWFGSPGERRHLGAAATDDRRKGLLEGRRVGMALGDASCPNQSLIACVTRCWAASAALAMACSVNTGAAMRNRAWTNRF